MPIIIMSLLIALICIFNWDFVVLNVQVIGTLATALAFFATAWAAFEARLSAKAAFSAVKLTRESLAESKKSSFKQWYSLLLEKNIERQKEVNEYLKENIELCSKLKADCLLDRVYNTITKDSILSSYVRNISHILNYIEREYYGDHSDLPGKSVFVEQLADIIPDRLKVVIAIYGLNYENLDHVENDKLRELLHKFNFFKNDLFFKEAIDEMHHIDDFINKRFIKKYRKPLFSEVLYKIEHANYTSMSLNTLEPKRSSDLLFSILYGYHNPAKKHIEYVFSKYIDHTTAEINIEIDNAIKRHAKNLREMKQLKGYCISIKPHRKLNPNRTMKTAGDVLNTTRKYITKAQKYQQKMLLLDDIWFCHPIVINDNLKGNGFERIVQSYALNLNLLKLRIDRERQQKIKTLVNSANAELMRNYDYLKSLS